jgi:5'(3')-deoxyribonucleotidase
MQKTKIAIDNDDTLLDFNEAVRLFHNANYDTNYQSIDVKEFALEKVWGCDFDEAFRRISEFWQTEYFNNMQPVSGAFEAVNVLKEKYDLFVLTARPEEVAIETKLAIKKHFPDLFTDVHFAPAFGAGQRKTKVEVCKELGIEVIIDDGIHNLELCAKEGIKCFMFERPWNMQHSKTELEEKGIIRVKNWTEVLQQLT